VRGSERRKSRKRWRVFVILGRDTTRCARQLDVARDVRPLIPF
jgi:hypothetical protein